LRLLEGGHSCPHLIDRSSVKGGHGVPPPKSLQVNTLINIINGDNSGWVKIGSVVGLPEDPQEVVVNTNNFISFTAESANCSFGGFSSSALYICDILKPNICLDSLARNCYFPRSTYITAFNQAKPH